MALRFLANRKRLIYSTKPLGRRVAGGAGNSKASSNLGEVAFHRPAVRRTYKTAGSSDVDFSVQL